MDLGAGIEARARHVRVADRLDLLHAVMVGDVVEDREDVVQDLHRLHRRELLGHAREADDVGEHHRHVGVALRDVHLVALEAVGDRGREDVEQEPLAPLLLLADHLVLGIDHRAQLLLLGGEVPQQHVDHQRDRGEVQHEEDRHGLQIEVLRHGAREEEVEGAREHRHEEPGEEPGQRLARSQHRHRANRRHQSPEAHARGVHEVADRPLHGERREEDERELDEGEEVELAHLPPQPDRDDRERLEDERDRRRVLVPHAPVDGEPERGRAHHEARGEHQHVARQFLLGRDHCRGARVLRGSQDFRVP